MSKRKIFLAVAMVGLILTTSACGEKKTNNGNNNNNPSNPTVTPTEPTGPIANTDEGVIYDYEIDGLKIDNVSLIAENGAAVFSANVTNSNAEDVYVNSFNITMRDADGNEIISTLGFVGDTLAPNASATITTNIFMDITKVKSIEYSRNY